MNHRPNIVTNIAQVYVGLILLPLPTGLYKIKYQQTQLLLRDLCLLLLVFAPGVYKIRYQQILDSVYNKD